MKIGIDIRLIGKKRTGDEAVFFNLVKNLAKIDAENEYLLFTDITNPSILSSMEVSLGTQGKKNFRIVSLKTLNKFTWNFWTLPNYLRKNPVDIYHTQYITPFFVSKKIKIVTTIHDISFNFYPKFIRWSDLFFLKLLIPLSIRRADRIIGVSKFTRNEIIMYYNVDPEKVDYIHNAVGDELKNTNFSSEDLEAVRRKYNLPERFALYIGTLQPRKNIPFLIQGISRLKKKLPELKMVIGGDPKARNYDQKINQTMLVLGMENDIVFPGFIEEADKAKIYQMTSVFIFPSFYEGFGIPLLEAMAANVPLAVSDIAPFHEVAEGAADYFDPENLDQFEKVVYNIFTNQELRQRLINSGKSRMELFSWEKSAQKTLEVYISLKN